MRVKGLPALVVAAILLAVVLAPANVAADPVTIFNETFPTADSAWSGSSDTAQDESGWVTIQGDGNNPDDIQVSDEDVGSSPSGGNHLTFEDCDHGFHTPEDFDIAYVSIDLSGYSGVEISYYWQDDDCDSTEGLRVAYSTDSTNGKDGTWTLMYEHINEADYVWVKDTYSLPDTACVATFKLRFSAYMSQAQEHIYVDDVMVTGSLPDTTPPVWSNPETDPEIIYENDVVTFFTDWDDDVALSGYIFSTNQSGTWVNESFTEFSTTPDIAEQVMTITASAGTTVEWRFYANDTSDNWNVTDIQTFIVEDGIAPWWSDPVTDPEIIHENDVVTFFTDWDDDVALSGYIFSTNQSGTWVNESFMEFSMTPDTAEQVMTITASAGTTVEWRFYANDTSDNWNVTDNQSFVVSSPAPPPSSPYMIYGWAFYENQTTCNDPVVNITNLNNSKQWQAETNASYNFYQITLASGTHLNASEILQFSVKAPDGSQSSTTYHTVTQDEINDGGLFDFNITLEAPVTPFVIYGWVDYSNGTACNNPTVNITNTNTSTQWQAETNSSYNYYQLILDTTKISAGDVLEFNVTDGTEHNTTTHMVTAGDIGSGGVFDFNLTLPSAPTTNGPTVDSITITPDDNGATSGVQIDPNPDGAKTVTVTVVVSDPDGYGDISTVNITDIAPDPAHGDPSPVTLVLQSGNVNTATYNGTFDMQFYDQPVEYTVTVTAKDTGGLSDADSSTFNYTSCTAMSLDSGTIAFGSIDPGENNTVAGDENMTTSGSPTVRNIGNVEIDVNITGSDMTSGGDTITKDRMDARVDELGYRDLGVARCFDANMAAGALSLENVDFRLNVPYATPTGSYNGSVTLTVDTCG